MELLEEFWGIVFDGLFYIKLLNEIMKDMVVLYFVGLWVWGCICYYEFECEEE